jgi:histidine ammonia-lyase
MTDRSPEEIRRSIEQNRLALAVSVERLRGEVAELTNWRKQLAEHQRQAALAAVLAGFLLGGGLFRRRKKP